MIENIDVVIRLVLIAVISGLVGLEREHLKKPAGLRTNMLVGVGSTLIMITALHLYDILPESSIDPGRLAGQVVTGIGFLGAGAIIQGKSGVHGLTTAAGIWVVSATGLAIGMGYYFAAIVTAIIMLVALFVFGRMEHHPDPTKNKDMTPTDLF